MRSWSTFLPVLAAASLACGESSTPGAGATLDATEVPVARSVPTCQPTAYEGIGAAVERTVHGTEITGLTPRGPAERSGLLVGDVVETVDGAPVASLALPDVHARLLGPAGTTVTLGVRHKSDPEKQTVAVTRERLAPTCL